MTAGRAARANSKHFVVGSCEFDKRPKGGIEADGITVVRAGFVLARSERFELPGRSSPKLRDGCRRSSCPGKARLFGHQVHFTFVALAGTNSLLPRDVYALGSWGVNGVGRLASYPRCRRRPSRSEPC